MLLLADIRSISRSLISEKPNTRKAIVALSELADLLQAIEAERLRAEGGKSPLSAPATNNSRSNSRSRAIAFPSLASDRKLGSGLLTISQHNYAVSHNTARRRVDDEHEIPEKGLDGLNGNGLSHTTLKTKNFNQHTNGCVAMSAKMTASDAANFLGISLQAVHKQLRSKQLPFAKSQNRVYFGHATARELFQLESHAKIISFQIVKGGTGKTSLAYSVAVRANVYGARVLCIDLDQQGNYTQAFRVNAEEHPCMVDVLERGMKITDAIVPVSEGLDLLPGRIENSVLDNFLMLNRKPLDSVYADLFRPLKEIYDVILIDCPPALGSSVAAAALASDLILAPVSPEKFSLSGLKLTTNEIASIEKSYKKNIPVRIVLNKYDNRTSLSHEVLAQLLKHPYFTDLLFKSYVRHSQEFPNAIAKGESVFETVRDTPAKEDVDLLTVELLELKAHRKVEKGAETTGNIEETLAASA